MAKHSVPGKTAKKTAAKKTVSIASSKAAAFKPAKKQSSKKAPPKKSAAKKMPARDKKTKDPKGGLTPAGREYFNEIEGSHLKPGVKGKADTPEKQKRKGSFLRRHFANPRGPMEKNGEPTRLALSAHAWGEAVPKNAAGAKKLAKKGAKLLEQYQAGKN